VGFVAAGDCVESEDSYAGASGAAAEDALCVFEKAAALSAKNAIAWELNELSGYRLAPYWLDQWHRIYEIALAAGVKLVYGSDAHTPDSIGLHDKVDILLAKLPDDCLAWPEEIIQL
jgi:hypothetical protein